MPTSTAPVAVITGASSGIGRAFARRYAREGYDLVLVARSGEALRSLADELHTRHHISAEPYVADLTKPDDVAALVEKLGNGLDRLDHLVNSAGVAPEGDLADADPAALVQVVDLNITALTLLTRAAIIRMREAGTGTIVNIASAAGNQAMPHFATYSASKAFVIMLTEAVSVENRRHGLRIFAVSPGDTDTGMGSSTATNKRSPEQVVDTAWRAMGGHAPSVIDGRANSALAVVSTRLLPKRIQLRVAERMMRRMA